MSSILKVDQLKDSGGNAIITSDGAGNLTAGTIPAKTIGTGAVLQVVQDVQKGAVTFSTGTYANALSLNITPSSTSSKILISWNVSCGVGSDDYGSLALFNGATEITGAKATNGSGNRINASNGISSPGGVGFNYVLQSISNSFLDSPNTTSEINYIIKMKVNYGSAVYMNRIGQTDDDTWNNNGISALTAYEIAG